MVDYNFAQAVLSKQLKGNFIKTLLTRLDIATGASCGDLGASIGLENDNDIFLWNVIFEGPADTLYEVSNRKSFTQN
jgi:hypothetical protein